MLQPFLSYRAKCFGVGPPHARALHFPSNDWVLALAEHFTMLVALTSRLLKQDLRIAANLQRVFFAAVPVSHLPISCPGRHHTQHQAAAVVQLVESSLWLGVGDLAFS